MIESVVKIDGVAFSIDPQPNLVTLVYPTKQQAEGEDPSDQEVSLGDTDSQDGTHDESHSSEDDADVQEKKKSSRSGLFKKIKKLKKKKRGTKKKKGSKLGSLLTSAKKVSLSFEPSKIIRAKLEERFVQKRHLINMEDSSGSLYAGRMGSSYGELEELPTIYETTELKELTTTKTSTETEAAERKKRKLTKRWKRLKRFLSIQKLYKMQHDDAGSTGSNSCNDTASTSTNSPTRTIKKQSDLDGAGVALVCNVGTSNPASTTDAILRSPPSFEEASPRLNLVCPPLPPAISRRGDVLPNLPVAEEESVEDSRSKVVVSPVPSPPGSPRKKILRYKKKSRKKVSFLERREETRAGAVDTAAIAVPSRPSQKEGSMHSLLRLVAAFLGALVVWQASRCELPRESKRAIVGPAVNDDWTGGANFFSTEEGVEMVAKLEWPHDQSWSEAPLEVIPSSSSVFEIHGHLDMSSAILL